MRSFVILAVLAVAAPGVDRARLAADMAYAVVTVAAAPAPSPSPSPTPAADACPECNGTGKLGDGTVFVTCPDCNGTGKKPAASLDTAASVKAFKAAQAAPAPVKAGPPRDGRTYRKICDPKTGTCRYELVR